MRMTEGRKVWLMWKVSFLWDGKFAYQLCNSGKYGKFMYQLHSRWKVLRFVYQLKRQWKVRTCLQLLKMRWKVLICNLQGEPQSKSRKKRASSISWEPEVADSHLWCFQDILPPTFVNKEISVKMCDLNSPRGCQDVLSHLTLGSLHGF